MNTILVTGGKGQLGIELQRAVWPEGWQVHAIDIDELDLTDSAAIAAAVEAQPYAAIISGGAYTAVDKAEDDQVTAWAVNALAPAALAAAAKKAGIPIVQVSTDYVFDGANPGQRRPDEPTAPKNVYGASKLGGELAVRSSGACYAIVRTAWVVSAHGNNFIKTMLRLAETRDELTVVDDQHGAPTAAADLAQALVRVTVALVDGRPSGIWHLANSGETVWADFARAIFAGSAVRGGPSARVKGIPSSDYPTPAARPAWSQLDTSDFTRDFGLTPRPWQDALDDILDELIGPKQ
ncbi:MAG TPA: dTDP-4-dehydrorhamnose reductase [Sphingomonas sp.]|nr:dTDP-4-dehydrorhamnose reductase [Sphingomonas sp.]